MLRLVVVMIDGSSSTSRRGCRFCRSAFWCRCGKCRSLPLPHPLCYAGGIDRHHSDHLLAGFDAIFAVPVTPDWSLMPRRHPKRAPDHNPKFKPQTLRSQT